MIAPRLRSGWIKRRATLLRVAVAVLSVCAMLKLGEGFWRLLAPTSLTGANDLRFRHNEVHQWFAGRPVYAHISSAVYPPASYALLWPALGWLAFTPARWLWGGTSLLAVAWLTYLLIEGSGAETVLERILVALLLLSMNATGLTIGNGQLILHVLPALLTSVLLLRHRRTGWGEELLIGLVLLLTLVKPTDSIPFFWLVLFFAGRLRPVLLVAVGYVTLTLLAASFQPVALSTLLAQWFANCSAVVANFGYANLVAWSAAGGLESWGLPASFFTLMALGVWTYCYRNADVWIVLGVVALVARLWTYHLAYDDVLVVVPLVALFRLAHRGPSADGGDVLAGVLLAATTAVMLTPETVRHAGPPWPFLFSLAHTMVWIPVLIFLLDRVRRAEPVLRGP